MKNLKADQIVALAASTAIKISKEVPPDELPVVSDFFSMIGASLMAIADRNALDAQDAPKKT